ncbi:Oidioi.mRNA.OKI2018_I69.XSR.g15079.t2.cds [Oikopleura dioica]|uniref:Oidioi.mRNA.OKI2018_I69.XSR.g15079.t2.cds n=1 Tax=Oikopleura dioica TaxID=34765 RepID=A0ABN7SC68_OIKDI|nr:Oidioi.mRNA.OKI2018_I69.XSR.g15079.t2.cds [Oikopleura dioica]
MRLTFCLLFISFAFAGDLKLSGWVSCSNWACDEAIQEGVARLNFIGLKSDDDVDWLKVQSGDTIVVTGKDAGTLKGVPLLHGHIKGKEEDKGSGLFPSSVLRVLRDKLRPLNSRRYFEDIQNEKRGIDTQTESDDSKAEASTPPPTTKAPPIATEAPRVDFKLVPLQKTSQIWTWIDSMLDERFVDRLLLTLKDEQSALLLLVSSRMATQKSQDKPELQRFHQLAKEVSAAVESAHGIGKRRESRTPPTLSELSELAHRVSQLLLDPYAATMYQNSKGFAPPKLQEVRVKYGIATDEEVNNVENTEKVEEKEIPDNRSEEAKPVEEATPEDNSNLSEKLNDTDFIEENPEEIRIDSEQIQDLDPINEPNEVTQDYHEEVVEDVTDKSQPSQDQVEPEDLAIEQDEQNDAPVVEENEPAAEETFEDVAKDDSHVENIDEPVAQLQEAEPTIEDPEGKPEQSEEPQVDEAAIDDPVIETFVDEEVEDSVTEDEIDLSLPEAIGNELVGEVPAQTGPPEGVDQEAEDQEEVINQTDEAHLNEDEGGEVAEEVVPEDIIHEEELIDEVAKKVQEQIQEGVQEQIQEGVQENTLAEIAEPVETATENEIDPIVEEEPLPTDVPILEVDKTTNQKIESDTEFQNDDLPLAVPPLDSNDPELTEDGVLEGDIQPDASEKVEEAVLVEEESQEKLESEEDLFIESEPTIPTEPEVFTDSPDNEPEMIIDPVEIIPEDIPLTDQDNQDAVNVPESQEEELVKMQDFDEEGSTELHLADVPESLDVGVITPESDSFKIDPEDESLEAIEDPPHEEDTPEPTIESTTPYSRETNPYRERELLKMLESKPLLFKITSWINVMGEETFSEFWLIYVLLSIFTFSFIRHLATICSDGGISAKMAILDKELAAKKSENDAKREKQDKEDLDRAQAELNSTRHEIKSIEEKITALRKFEAQFDQYLQQLNDSAIEMSQKTEELRAQDTKFTAEMESEGGKYTELQQFSSQDAQAVEDINAHEADLKEKIENMLSQSQNMLKEQPKIEADLKKAKLVNQNFVQELEELKSASDAHSANISKLSAIKNDSEEKLSNVQQNVFDQKVVYAWLEANADCAGDSAEEIILNQRSYLVNAIKRIPMQQSENKRLLQENEELTNRLEAIRASCAELDKKIDDVETSEELEAQFTELKEEVETLQAKLEVTNDYYAKRETEINAQLGTESAERDNFESSYNSQKERESQVKEQLDTLKEQCADLESKWEDADVKFNKMLAELEERKTSNFLALTDTEMKVVQLTQVVRSLRNDTNEIDDRIEQAQEYMAELEMKIDDSSRSDRRSDTGSDLGSMSRSIVSTAMDINITVQYNESNSFYDLANYRSDLRYPMPVDVRKRPTRLVSSASAIWSWQFRIILVGDSTVGKSALLKRFTEGSFAETSDPTVGVDFFARVIEIEDSVPDFSRCRLQIWDTAGQERFRSIARSYYRNAVGALIVYDITSRKSFENASNWLKDAQLHAENGIAIALAGQKSDLDARREVSTEEAETWAHENNLPFLETSAKNDYNVERIFSKLAVDIYNRINDGRLKSCEGIKSGLVPAQPLSDIASPIDDSGCTVNTSECCNATGSA